MLDLAAVHETEVDSNKRNANDPNATQMTYEMLYALTEKLKGAGCTLRDCACPKLL